MKCPEDGTELIVHEREGIELNICPRCQGVWMARQQVERFVASSERWSAGSAEQPYDEDGYHPTAPTPTEGIVARVFSD